MDKVQDHARVREVIFVGLVMTITSYPILSHRRLNENRKLDKVLDAARIDEAEIMEHLDTIVKSTIVSGNDFNNQKGKVGIRLGIRRVATEWRHGMHQVGHALRSVGWLWCRAGGFQEFSQLAFHA